VEGVVKTAKTAWEALPLTGDEASTTAARERIGKGVLGTLDGMATLIGPSAEEIITARETGNPDAMAYVEQRQQEQKEMARTLGDGVEQEFDKVHERSGTAGVVGALGAMTAIVVVSKGVGAVVGKAFSKVKVTAKAQVGEHVFHDTNQGARPAALADSAKPTLIAAKVDARNQKLKPGRGPTPNGNMADAHAEVGAIQQAHDAGVAKGADMVMEVEGRDVCGFCKSDIPAMAEKAELKSLKITSTDDKGVVRNYYWQPGAKLKEIK
jgi:filamentous hemagglutinin